jgi:hypothetical protein
MVTYKIYEEDKPSNPSPTPKQIYWHINLLIRQQVLVILFHGIFFLHFQT